MTYDSPYFGYIQPLEWQEPAEFDPENDQESSDYVSPEESDDF